MRYPLGASWVSLVTPTTAVTAPKIPSHSPSTGYSDFRTTTQTMRYAFAQNLTGLPAISIPVGQDSSGLPIGVQLTGPAWSEAQLFQVGSVVEEDAVSKQKRPPLFFDLLKP
jgi:aspartyl-tRNA(Asn)/glutamyl-tRNA(Gln) amidotransferase subunit A